MIGSGDLRELVLSFPFSVASKEGRAEFGRAFVVVASFKFLVLSTEKWNSSGCCSFRCSRKFHFGKRWYTPRVFS
jgi:hypothetical protein